jgi:16S rRNA (guanine527-N7)-methyltransferase
VTGSDLDAVVAEAQRRGFVGPGPVSRQLSHAADLAAMLDASAGRILDLGSGGGLPGLVVAAAFPNASVVLLEAQRRRCEFLRQALQALDLGDRCRVAEGRAEELARDPELRGTFDLITARSFGPPATTAECAVGFLSAGGHLVVTEPPAASTSTDDAPLLRWPPEGLALLGLEPAETIQRGETSAARMMLLEPVLERWPRRVGVPSKRPLWTASSRRST